MYGVLYRCFFSKINKLDLARIYWLLGWIVVAKFYQNSFNVYQTNYDKALEFAMKSLGYHNKLNHTVSIADDYTLIAMKLYLVVSIYLRKVH